MTEKRIRDLIADASDMSDRVTDFIDYLGDDNHLAIEIIDGQVALGIGTAEGKGLVILDPEAAASLAIALAEAVASLRDDPPL